MTRFLRSILLWPIGKPDIAQAASTMGKRGAQVRETNWKAKRNAVVAQLCAETGQPVPECLR